jgi:perosamine synthetase
MTMPLEYLVFSPSACGFPKPRIPPLPDGLACLSPKAPTRSAWGPTDSIRHFTRGRYALREAYRLAGIGSGSALLAPAYHCRTMIDPALALGGDVLLYPLEQDLAPDMAALDELLDCSTVPVKALLATHFFGIPQELAKLSAWCATHGLVLIEDCSHVFFCEGNRPPGTSLDGDFVISSPYKFLPSPDGGLLYTRQAHRLDAVEEHTTPPIAELRGVVSAFSQARQHHRAAKTCVPARIDAELAAVVERSPNPGIDSRQRENCSADYQSADEGLASLRFSRLIWRHADIGEVSRRRQENFRRWAAALAGIPYCRPHSPQLPEGCVPYMFPLYIDRPDPHFYWLKHLGVPVWRWDSIAASACPTANDYRLHLLHLPCHQSLTETELDWMISAVDKVMRHPVPEAN